MYPLRSLSQQRWSLDAFVDQVNALLPEVLPADPVNTRVKPEINARLVRHHSGEGLLDEPLKEGREARYGYRHLLQLLVIRRLLAAGLSAGAIGNLVRKKGEPELEGILEGGATVEVTATLAAPGQSALAFLAALRAGEPMAPVVPGRQRKRQAPPDDSTLAAALPSAFGTPSASAPSPDTHRNVGKRSETSWERHAITDGLELHIRSDFRAPESPKAHRNLLALIEQRLLKRGRP